MPTFTYSCRNAAEEMKCAVCQAPWIEPRELDECGHIFCEACVERLKRCPMCRTVFGRVRTPNRVIVCLAQRVRSRCDRCGWTGPHSESINHKCSVELPQQPSRPSVTRARSGVPVSQAVGDLVVRMNEADGRDTWDDAIDRNVFPPNACVLRPALQHQVLPQADTDMPKSRRTVASTSVVASQGLHAAPAAESALDAPRRQARKRQSSRDAGDWVLELCDEESGAN